MRWLLLLLIVGCAHAPPRPLLWEMCRDACAAQGAPAAAVAGTTDGAHLVCACAGQKEST